MPLLEHAIAAIRNLTQPEGRGTVSRSALLSALTSKGTEWGAAFFSIVILVVIAVQLYTLDIHRITASVPASPLFWLAFSGYYVAGPVTDWIKLRRLWALPISGFSALLAKLVGNEMLLSYSGDAYFYAWSRKHMVRIAAPFDAVKDLALISALVGSLMTLTTIVVVWPMVDLAALGAGGAPLVLGASVALASGGLVSFFARRFFSLSLDDIMFVAMADVSRVIAQAGFAILMWHFALPQVALTAWIMLSALRLIVSRLPLVPNKELIFAGMVAVIVGRGSDIAPMIAMTGGMVVLTHILVGAGLIADRLSSLRVWRADSRRLGV